MRAIFEGKPHIFARLVNGEGLGGGSGLGFAQSPGACEITRGGQVDGAEFEDEPNPGGKDRKDAKVGSGGTIEGIVHG